MRSVALFFALLLTAAMPRPAHALVVLGWHDIRPTTIPDGEPDTEAVTTRNFAMQLDWLRAHGYVPVTAQAVRDARAGRGTLPANAVLLTFDGGYRSVYTQALPVLRAFNYPALVALPTSRLDASADVRVGTRDVPRSAFLGWSEVKALQASGLIDFATQGHDLATPIAGDPQGDLLPAALVRRWNGGYETEAAQRERIRADLATSVERIERATGRRPQLVVWPSGGASGAARAAADSLGLATIVGPDGRTNTSELRYAGGARVGDPAFPGARLVMSENAGASDVAYELRRDPRLDGIRAVRVSLDDIAAAGPSGVDALAERIRAIHPSHVIVDAMTSDGGAWFAGSSVSTRSDVLSHVAARIKARSGAQVLAWMPANASSNAYADVAATAVDGVVVADGGDAAVAAVDAVRPDFVKVRSIPISTSDPSATAGQLPAMTSNYDFLAVMLPPDTRASRGAVDRTVRAVAASPDALDRTVFVIDAGDATNPLPPDELEAQARRVVASGGRHVGYSRDVPLKDVPPLDPARAAISARAFPYQER
ncbi:polysaccharide deacetylase family protein [Cognatilysobacter terrigena]|uniref:polysaccharide deacetylase family protein n=1 Tax=Cognatilysobacter terrigena TaxID=2488749 RepID=UPI00105B9C27|nr:polysaccharide deacetylase family protein [Lysobacter terrigena]